MSAAPIRVLVACERSGVVREAFNQYAGVHAMSCDLVPADDGRHDAHHVGDVRELLMPGAWDLVIAHPPCTRLCLSGVRWLHERNLWGELDDAVRFFQVFNTWKDCPVAIENPIPHGHALRRIGRKYDQIVQPWQFGHGESKAMCLWLCGLPKLAPTNMVEGRRGAVHRMSSTWSVQRSRTYVGIAQAMAAQWVPHILQTRAANV